MIFGLGNIGEKYEGTRHNIGFMVLDALAKKKNLTFASGKFVQVAKFQAGGNPVFLLKPTTFMNLSGDAVVHWKKQTESELSDILIITDDISLPQGKIRIRSKGSSGGHNGLASIEEKLHSQDFARMRMGIGSDFPKGRQVEFVLGKFPQQDEEQIQAWIEKATEAVLCFVSRGLETTMNQFNG